MKLLINHIDEDNCLWKQQDKKLLNFIFTLGIYDYSFFVAVSIQQITKESMILTSQILRVEGTKLEIYI